MTDERWDVPSERLRRVAALEPFPLARECPRCHHRHPKGERCGYQVKYATTDFCGCRQ